VQNNLGIARYPLQGIRASLDTFESGIRFCRQRGLAEAELALATCRLSLLAEVGRPDDALVEAGEISAAFEATGQVTDLVEVRAVDVAIRFARGEQPSTAEIEWVVETARKVGHVDVTPVAFSCAAVVLASEAPDRARALLRELEQAPAARGVAYYMRQLAAIVRTALATGDRALAERLVESIEPHYPLDEHARCAASAQLAEHAGDLAEAAALYADAAERWHAFGNVPERAYALLGEGRCLLMLGRPEAEQPLREARGLFASMGYEPVLVETEGLLEQIAAPSAP
jgi:hypothetical protein